MAIGFSKSICGAIVATIALFAGATAAYATAFAGVQQAVWDVWFAYYIEYQPDGSFSFASDVLPDGVTMTCNGSAIDGGELRCRDLESLSLTNSSSQVAHASLFSSSSVGLTNNSGTAFPGYFIFATSFSAFNNGGPEIGASVDSLTSEYASFTSEVGGPGVGDYHSCDTRDPSAYHPTPNSCGVPSPDASDGEFDLGPLDPGTSMEADYFISIDLVAKGAPEPMTLSLFIAAAAGTGAMRWRRKLS